MTDLNQKINECFPGLVVRKDLVKAVKGKIMDNAYGAADDLADAKLSDEAKEAINRKYSEFKGKKGDFTGMFLRLKKKK